MKQVIRFAVSLILWPVTQLLWLCQVRILTGGQVLTRIGHLALAPDLYLKSLRLGWGDRHHGILLAPGGQAANPALLRYWRRYLTIVTHPSLVMLLRVLECQPRLQHNLGFVRMPDGEQVKIVPAVYQLQAAYESALGGDPLLSLDAEVDRRGRDRLKQLGMPPDAWFVCLHVREAGYLPQLTHHAYRNSDVTSYLPAVEAIVARGGWVLRMGDRSMQPLPKMAGVIDYVHSGLQADWMDVFCFARCRFFLGDTSGPFNVAYVFGVPCALANFIPFGHGAFGKQSLWIPKRARSLRDERDLTFEEMLRPTLRALWRTEHYEAAGIAWVDNAPEEIRDLALEMCDRLDGRWSCSPEDEQRQRRFKALLELDPLYGTTARVGRDFLWRHAQLFEGGLQEELGFIGAAPQPQRGAHGSA